VYLTDISDIVSMEEKLLRSNHEDEKFSLFEPGEKLAKKYL